MGYFNPPREIENEENEENEGVINMGRGAAFDALVGELCDMFHPSPWIHLGTDEVNKNDIDSDPDCRKYMGENDLKSAEELYRHFIVRMNDIVKNRGKALCIWEGFGPGGREELVTFTTNSLVPPALNAKQRSWLPLNQQAS